MASLVSNARVTIENVLLFGFVLLSSDLFVKVLARLATMRYWRRDFAERASVIRFQDQNLECSPLDAFPSGFQDLEALSDRHWGDEPLFVNSMKQHNVQTYVNSLQKLDSTLHSAAAPDSCKLAQRARAANGCRVIVFFGEPGCDKFKLVQSAVQLAGLIPSWKIVRYHSEVSPVQIDSDKLADKVLEALPSDAIDAGIILVVSSFAPAAWVVAAVADNARLKSAVYLERMVAVVNATSILTPGNNFCHKKQSAVSHFDVHSHAIYGDLLNVKYRKRGTRGCGFSTVCDWLGVKYCACQH